MIVYCSNFFQPSQYDFFAKNNKNFNPYSAHNLSFAIFEGLSQLLNYEELSVINIPPIGFFPKLSSVPIVSPSLDTLRGITIRSLGYKNFYLYQHYDIYKQFCKILEQQKINGKCVYLVYGICFPLLKALLKFKKNNSNIKIVLIIPDFIEDMYQTSLKNRIRFAIQGPIQSIYEEIDGYVLLTEQMTDKVGKEKPYCVVEGVYNSQEERINCSKSNSPKRFFYSGMLFEKFGVKNMIDAFCQLTNPNLRLQVCGCGDLEEYIKEKAAEDMRIEFLGMLPRTDVLELQSKATILVNPRQPVGDFTKYSFPSKTIEYMASGTPLLMYKLPGIPEEYYEYCYWLDNEHLTVFDLKEKMQQLLDTPLSDLIKKGRDAKDFILNKKNSKEQCKKIVRVIEQL